MSFGSTRALRKGGGRSHQVGGVICGVAIKLQRVAHGAHGARHAECGAVRHDDLDRAIEIRPQTLWHVLLARGVFRGSFVKVKSSQVKSFSDCTPCEPFPKPDTFSLEFADQFSCGKPSETRNGVPTNQGSNSLCVGSGSRVTACVLSAVEIWV